MTRKVGEKKEYSMEIVETAENLYIYKNKTYEEISKLLDVPVVTLQRWGADEKTEKGGKGGYGWRKKKLEQIKQRVDYRRNLYDLRDKMLKAALETTDPQTVHAIANLQRIIEAEEKMKPIEDLPGDPEKATGLSEETLAKIKEQVYGISSENRKQNT